MDSAIIAKTVNRPLPPNSLLGKWVSEIRDQKEPEDHLGLFLFVYSGVVRARTFTAASIKAQKRGWGRVGREANSG